MGSSLMMCRQKVDIHRPIEEPVRVIPRCDANDGGPATDHARLRMGHATNPETGTTKDTKDTKEELERGTDRR